MHLCQQPDTSSTHSSSSSRRKRRRRAETARASASGEQDDGGTAAKHCLVPPPGVDPEPIPPENLAKLSDGQSSSTECFVGGLSKFAREEDLCEAFGRCGVIVELRLMRTRAGRSKGFAFVRFGTALEANWAVQVLHQTFVVDRRVSAACSDNGCLSCSCAAGGGEYISRSPAVVVDRTRPQLDQAVCMPTATCGVGRRGV